jgi:thioredoxin reductase
MPYYPSKRPGPEEDPDRVFREKPREKPALRFRAAWRRIGIAASAAVAPSDAAVVTCRMFFLRQSPATKTPGVFVAGDCRAKNIRQLTTAVGDGSVAALAACRYIDRL